MYPIIIQYGDFVLASWHLFFVIGAFAAWFGINSLRSTILPELKERELDRLFVLLYICGYFGARIFSILFEEKIYNPLAFIKALFSFGSMTLYGGIIAVTIATLIFSYRKNLAIIRIASLFVGPGLMAIGIGRIGCFLNGDDFGKAIPDQLSPSWWTVQFPNLGDSIYRYPVQLWEAAFGILSGLLLIILARRFPTKTLWVADAGVIAYTSARFVLEYYRGDERGYFLGSVLSTSQGVSILLLAIWITFRLRSSLKTKTL